MNTDKQILQKELDELNRQLLDCEKKLLLIEQKEKLINIISKNILEANENFIIQQCSCSGRRAMGLSQQISDKFGVNPYNRKINDKPGTYKLNKNIVCLFAQLNPGKPNNDDTKNMRLIWFKESFEQFIKENKGSIAIPYKIGCGYGGGDWNDYFKIIEELSNKYKLKINIYKFNC